MTHLKKKKKFCQDNAIDGQFYNNSLRLLSTTQLLKTVLKSNLSNRFTVEGNNFFSLTLGKQQPSLQERRQEKSIMRKETTRTDVGQTLKTVA
jgi:hypothetical protein